MITISDLSLNFSGEPLFKDVNLKFTQGNCYGVIGANGAGKSTFLRILSGDLDPSTGTVSIAPKTRMSVLKQDHFAFNEETVLNTVLGGNERLLEVMHEKDALYMKDPFTEEDGNRAAELESEFAEMGGWDAETEASQLLNGLGLDADAILYTEMKNLGDVEKVKVLLARALFGKPDILLLDEPTNHLDIQAVRWLEDFLADFEGTVLVVSHDRHFLNNVCTHIVDIDYGKIKLYVGNYEFWYESSQLVQRMIKDQNRKNEEKIKELQNFIQRFAANKSKSRQATSRRKLIDKLSVEEMPASSRRYPWVAFDADREAGKDILEVRGISKTIDGEKVLDNVTARDQHGNPCGIPSDIEWTLAGTNQTNATIENGKLLVAVGSVPDASYADVILEASSASAGKTAKNVVVKVEQQPTLKTIRADMKDGFVLRLDENAVLADQFTAAGYDQYGREMTGGSREGVTSKPDVVSLENGTLKALKEDSTEIYARSGDIESNHITLTVNAPRRLTAITADGIPSSVRKNTTLDLSAVKVTTLDQFGKAFTPEELAAYPASVRWTLEKNDTHAVISGNTLSFGDQDGTMTLICAAVNADTNVIVEKKIIIRITDSTSGGGSSGGGGGGGGGGFSAPSYSVSVDDVKHGTVTVSPKSASKGDTVTITATPDKGYTLESLTVLDKDGKALELTDKGGGKYTFVMPAGKVTVKAVFMDDNTMLNFFTDVHAEDYYYDAVLWAAQKGITGGMSDTLFAPNAACTRAQIVTFLWRAAGSPEPKALSSFADVPADAYYARAVAWAVENGITEGTSDTTFAPGTICTRAQGAAFLYRAAGSPAVSGSAAFTDVPIDAYYADAAAWAEQKGITGGIGNGLFGPHNNCTRAQIVTFLYRMYGSK